MTQQNEESGSGSVPIFDIVLSLIAVASPFVWIWTTEVALVSHDMHGLIFFVWAISGVFGYHVTMYVMFVSVFLLAVRVLQLSISRTTSN